MSEYTLVLSPTLYGTCFQETTMKLERTEYLCGFIFIQRQQRRCNVSLWWNQCSWPFVCLVLVLNYCHSLTQHLHSDIFMPYLLHIQKTPMRIDLHIALHNVTGFPCAACLAWWRDFCLSVLLSSAKRGALATVLAWQIKKSFFYLFCFWSYSLQSWCKKALFFTSRYMILVSVDLLPRHNMIARLQSSLS